MQHTFLSAGINNDQRSEHLAYRRSPIANTPTSFYQSNVFIALGFAALCIPAISCKKLVSIPEPVTSVTTLEAFSSDAQANSAISGIYQSMIQNTVGYACGSTTIYLGMSADELTDYYGSSDLGGYQFNSNQLLSNNSYVYSYFWADPYFSIYQANASIEALNSPNGLSDSAKSELLGEAKFVRAFSYFYLTNLFGSVPLAITSSYQNNTLLPRSTSEDVYHQIVSDLTEAEQSLLPDYSAAMGQRVRPNRWAAASLLARVYLYQQTWDSAVAESSAVISSGMYTLETDLTGVFSANSSEAIWQLDPNESFSPLYNITAEGYYFIPSAGYNPSAYLTDTLINSFEPGDLRFTTWVDSINYNGILYYIPFKYNLGVDQISPGSNPTQFYMLLRFAEQYLIRAEAEAELGQTAAALSDLNTIRARAALGPYSGAIDKASLLTAIEHENQIEFFCEWGHRWFDLIRWGNAATTLTNTKSISVPTSALLLPIPVQETQTDPNLGQNPGY